MVLSQKRNCRLVDSALPLHVFILIEYKTLKREVRILRSRRVSAYR